MNEIPIAAPVRRRKSRLYLYVLISIVLGVILGSYAPKVALKAKFLGEIFIALIKMMVPLLVFTSVVLGIAKAGSGGRVGRLAVKAILYFEAVTTLALLIGLLVGHIVRPGDRLRTEPQSSAVVQTDDASRRTQNSGSSQGAAKHSHGDVSQIVPESLIAPLVSGNILQVLMFAILAGCALRNTGPVAGGLVTLLDQLLSLQFAMINLIVLAAPLGAFGAMAYTVGQHGLSSLFSLLSLLLCVYVTCLCFIVLVLGTVARINGFSLWRLLVYIREELLIVLGTSSSESALPGLMKKLQQAGCADDVVGLVVPMGYSFNLDGTSIYLTMAAAYLAQVSHTTLSIQDQLAILGVFLLTSKGAAAVTGGGMVTLQATLNATGTIPLTGLEPLMGIDRFMSEARAVTNLIGNAVAAIVIAGWERKLDRNQLNAALSRSGSAAITDREPVSNQ